LHLVGIGFAQMMAHANLRNCIRAAGALCVAVGGALAFGAI
jgi:hydrogenase/urease accessory protein HupE